MARFIRILGGAVVGGLCFTSVNAAQMPPFPVAADSSDAIVRVQDAPPGMWRGYRGIRDQRPGYRRGHDGWWYPLAAFAAGAIIGGAVAGGNGANEVPPPEERRPPPVRPVQGGYGQAFTPDHYAWCAKRYRTYRASDNTYVPSAGIRAQCRSPY